jgi:hypothetical protein
VNNFRIDPGYVKIDNLAQFLVRVPSFHPSDPRYTQFWSYEIAKCIEGVWGKMFGGYRYMPGNLYFYGNYTKIQDTDPYTKETRLIKPEIWDIIWEISYYMQVCKGFSGYENDLENTCDERYFDLVGKKVSEIDNELLPYLVHLFKENGELKTYKEPLSYIRSLQEHPLGAPLYANPAKNFILLGSRGGGKSYYMLLGELLYHLTFDNAKRYNDDFIYQRLKTEVAIGAAIVDKSSESCNKIIECMGVLATDPELGAWGKPGELDYTPSPMFRSMSGSIKVNNKKNPYRYEYEVLEDGYTTTKGTGSCLFHINYAMNKKDSSEAAAGGRYSFNGYEEIGLIENWIDILQSNKFTVSRNGVQIGPQVGWGTSGNLERLQDTRKVFLSPKTYNFISMKDVWEGNGDDGRIGFFLPYAATIKRFKDKNGNTDWEKAFDHIEIKLEEASQNPDPKVLRAVKMHAPNLPSDMWTNDLGNLLPKEEAAETKKRLLKGNKYKSIATTVDLKWDNAAPYGVSYDINNKEFIYQYPINIKKMQDPSGTVVLYEPPVFINGIIPPDLYAFIGHDPYVAEEIDKGGSLGVTYVVKNPKYFSEGINGNLIVASYIGKPIEGLAKYYENQEKLIALYGNPPRSLWYESVRGDNCRSHYIKKKKLYLLCIAPQKEQGNSLYQKNIVRTGYSVGNKISKLNLINLFNDWLLEEFEYIEKDNTSRITRPIFEIPCLFLLSQIEDYNLNGNFDAVSAMLGAILGLREYEQTYEESTKKKTKYKSLNKLANNALLFSDLH